MPLYADNPNHLIVGLGGTGGKVLKAFKKRLFKEHPSPQQRNELNNAVTFLYVDSTTEMMKPGDPTFRVAGQDASFTPQEFLNIKSIDINQILDNIENYPGLRHIIQNSSSMRSTLGEVGAAAGQKRRAGRILFAVNCNRYLAALQDRYEALRNLTRKDTLHIHIVTGLAGGTGSGSIIDAVAQAIIRYPDALIDVYAMIPEKEIPAGCQAGRYHQNGYAALRELSAMNVCRFLPCDVITGAQHVRFNEGLLKQFSMMVYSNVNENGLVVDSFTELPEIVADAMYMRIFMQNKPTTQGFMRAWSCENFNDFLVENDTKSRAQVPHRARTKAVSTLGLKRIIYPEVRIQEHINSNTALDIIKQMLYNNFKEEFGYVEEPIKTDYKEKFINPAQLNEWLIDDSHLQLNVRILPTDKSFLTFKEFWTNAACTFSYEEAKRFDKHHANIFLYNYCEEQFLGKNGGKFRLGRSVEEYYNDKGDDRVLKEQVAFIVEQIEQGLYTNWANGVYSIHDLTSICNELLKYFETQISDLPKKITSNEEFIAQCELDKADLDLEWDTYGLLLAPLKHPRLYGEYQALCADLFVGKTKRFALSFQGRILQRLKVEFLNFKDQLDAFIGRLQRSKEYLINAISERSKKGALDIRGSEIEVYEDEKITNLEDTLKLSKSDMEVFATVFRNALTQGATFAHFNELANYIRETTILDLANALLTERIEKFHNDNCREEDKVLGINVLQQLHKILQTQDAIQSFANDIIHQSGVFMKFNIGQMTRALNNNPNPVTNPESINRNFILVTIPTCEGNDSLREFTDQLVTAMRESFGNETPGSVIMFDRDSTRKNEISIITIKSCFPLRCLEWMPQYDEEYSQMINHHNESTSKQAKEILHSEGDGTELPGLMGEPETPRGMKLFPYIFIAAITGTIKYGENHREEKGWCLSDIDMFGAEIITLVSKRFIEIEPNLVREQAEKIFEVTSEILNRNDKTVSERNELKEAVKRLMRDYIVVECEGPNNPIYSKYSEAAVKAMELIDRM